MKKHLAFTLFYFFSIQSFGQCIYNAQTLQPTCTSGCTGIVQFTASGGVAPYFLNISAGPQVAFNSTYQWTTACAGWHDYSVTDFLGNCHYLGVVYVNSLPAPVAIITAGGSTTFCSPGSVTLTASFQSDYTYQWRLNSSAISGATSISFVATSGGTYDCIVTGICGSATSNTITVTVNSAPSASITSSGPTTVCYPSSVSLVANIGMGFSYQWRMNGGNISGASGAFYSATSTGNYDCIVSNTCGSSTSNVITATVNSFPTASISATGPTTFCSPGSVTLNANTGIGLLYQWSWSGSNISGATSSSYSATSTGNYGCLVYNTCGSAVSNVIEVTASSFPTASISASGSTAFCSGGSVTLYANFGSGLSYQWRLNGGNISGATLYSYSASATGNYDCAVSNICGSAASNTILVTVNSIPTASISASGSTTFCSPGMVTLNASTGSGFTYQWRLNGANISSANGVSYSATSTGNYDCIISNSCGSATSNAITVTVNSAPTAVITASGSTTFCSGGSVTLNANTGSGLSYQWKLNNANISGGTSSSYSATSAGNYKCVVSNTCGNAVSNTIAVTVNNIPATPGSIAGQTTGVCSSAKTYSISNVANATSYTWSIPSGASITNGQGTTTLNVTFTNSFSSGTISVTASNSCGTSGSSSITVAGAPAQPGTITGLTSVCHNQNNVIYSITQVTGATSYTWTVPAGTQIKTGQGTKTIKVRFGNSGGDITVTANNSCGSSAVRSLAVAMTCKEGEEYISQNDFDVHVSPNPSFNDFTFVMNVSKNNSYSINIIDMVGRVVESYQFSSNNTSNQEFKCGASLSSGIYFAEIISGREKKVLKLIKEE